MRISVTYKLRLPTRMTLNAWAYDIGQAIHELTQRPAPAVGVLVHDSNSATFDVTPTTVAKDELTAIAYAVINPTRSLDILVDVS